MGYGKGDGAFADTTDLGVTDSATALKASSAITANGQTAGRELGDRPAARLKLDVTAVAGTNPTLDIVIETSFDNGVTDAWRTVASFAQKTGTGNERKSFTGLDRFVRARWTIGGTATPSFTFSIIGEAV